MYPAFKTQNGWDCKRISDGCQKDVKQITEGQIYNSILLPSHPLLFFCYLFWVFTSAILLPSVLGFQLWFYLSFLLSNIIFFFIKVAIDDMGELKSKVPWQHQISLVFTLDFFSRCNSFSATNHSPHSFNILIPRIKGNFLTHIPCR